MIAKQSGMNEERRGEERRGEERERDVEFGWGIGLT